MLVLIATENELKIVKELGYENNPVLITGVGGINVINSLKNISKDTEILNIGYAGSNKLPIGSKVQIDDVHTYHINADFYENELSCKFRDFGNDIRLVDCYTSTDFVTKTNIEDPCVFDMELAFIRSMFNNVSSIKVVSDNLNYTQYEINAENKTV